MKKWYIILALLLLLTGCSKEATTVDRPYSLEMEYGESTVYAKTNDYQWYWKDGRQTETATVDADAMGVSLDTVPYLNAGKEKTLRLQFSKEPDKVLVQKFSAADGYTAAEEVTAVGDSIPAPLDGGDYLYEVSAVWMENSEEKNWGSCTYRFFFLAEGAPMSNPVELEVAADLDLAGLLELEANQVLGIEFLNNLEGTTRTCRSGEDKTAILQFFRSNLVSSLQPMGGSAPQSEYAMRLVTVSGNQLTVSYAGGSAPCLTVGGVCYSVNSLDLATLWASLNAGSISLDAAASGKNYLEMSMEFPGEDWGNSFVYGYLRQMDQAVGYDEMRWIDDAAEANGYRLEKGWSGQTAELSENCEFWILENHHTPYCRVTAEELWQWTQNAGFDVLYRIYTTDGVITAICQQYIP